MAESIERDWGPFLTLYLVAPPTIHVLIGGLERMQVKIAPETALKLTFNDAMKHVVCADPEQITAGERMVGGAIAGASAQVRGA